MLLVFLFPIHFVSSGFRFAQDAVWCFANCLLPTANFFPKGISLERRKLGAYKIELTNPERSTIF